MNEASERTYGHQKRGMPLLDFSIPPIRPKFQLLLTPSGYLGVVHSSELSRSAQTKSLEIDNESTSFEVTTVMCSR